MEALRASLLGQQLRWIAEYVEGYLAAREPERKQRWAWSKEEEVVVRGGMRREVYAVCAIVYGSAAEGNAWSYLRQWQQRTWVSSCMRPCCSFISNTCLWISL
ncbi:hypothetical protein KSX_87120 [Ktedonospora formicarum]|uniref:Uncharacterized protein n=2 Tax=Ktedonospora formicarum TaxID=2778364 RepID=A0A8J3I6N4_9CHLR|nr:hypothetical protein KSX_87120 [Ktedonospora formicarum]